MSQRSDIPEWLKTTPLWVEFSFARWQFAAPSGVQAQSAELAELLGVEWALHYYVWYRLEQKDIVNAWTPKYTALQDFPQLVKTLQHAHNVHVVPYTNG
eukprot:COSAG04_NODE_18072_length_451_cov_1.786932_1_plen_98_part_10